MLTGIVIGCGLFAGVGLVVSGIVTHDSYNRSNVLAFVMSMAGVLLFGAAMGAWVTMWGPPSNECPEGQVRAAAENKEISGCAPIELFTQPQE